jgi:hypothetical protein
MLPIGSICSLGGIFTMRESKVWLGVLILVIGSVISSGTAKATNENNLLTKHDIDIIATSQVAFLVSNQKKLEKYENAHSLTDEQLVDMLSAVGFKGKSLRSACAIAKAESNGRPLAFNGNLKTGDNSYGVFQINMLGELGSDRREKFDLDSNAELLNPVVNAQIALHMTKGGEDWSSWTSKYGIFFLFKLFLW